MIMIKIKIKIMRIQRYPQEALPHQLVHRPLNHNLRPFSSPLQAPQQSFVPLPVVVVAVVVVVVVEHLCSGESSCVSTNDQIAGSVYRTQSKRIVSHRYEFSDAVVVHLNV